MDALKVYCRKRNLRTTGSKAELVVRVFAASEMAIPPTAEEQLSGMEKEKAKLLVMPDGQQLPDRLALKHGWLPERESITSWPPIFLSDITLFLMADHPGKDVDFRERILNEYMEDKAYRLFSSGWLKEVYLNYIAPDSDYCFLKAKCTHTTKISDTPHMAWVSVVLEGLSLPTALVLRGK